VVVRVPAVAAACACLNWCRNPFHFNVLWAILSTPAWIEMRQTSSGGPWCALQATDQMTKLSEKRAGSISTNQPPHLDLQSRAYSAVKRSSSKTFVPFRTAPGARNSTALLIWQQFGSLGLVLFSTTFKQRVPGSYVGVKLPEECLQAV